MVSFSHEAQNSAINQKRVINIYNKNSLINSNIERLFNNFVTGTQSLSRGLLRRGKDSPWLGPQPTAGHTHTHTHLWRGYKRVI